MWQYLWLITGASSVPCKKLPHSLVGILDIRWYFLLLSIYFSFWLCFVFLATTSMNLPRKGVLQTPLPLSTCLLLANILNIFYSVLANSPGHFFGSSFDKQTTFPSPVLFCFVFCIFTVFLFWWPLTAWEPWRSFLNQEIHTERNRRYLAINWLWRSFKLPGWLREYCIPPEESQAAVFEDLQEENDMGDFDLGTKHRYCLSNGICATLLCSKFKTQDCIWLLSLSL